MKRFVLIILFAATLSACARTTNPQEQSFIPVDGIRATPTPVQLTVAQQAAVLRLAFNLGVSMDRIRVVSDVETEFTDACLGVSLEGVMCAQAITPGRTITLETDGLEFEYRVNADESRMLPATVALVWERDGGIAGFCDRATVFLSGEVYGSDCRSENPDAAAKSFVDLMTDAERTQFLIWAKQFGSLNLDDSDPVNVVADRMTVTLQFYGKGNQKPTESEQRALFDMAQKLYQGYKGLRQIQ